MRRTGLTALGTALTLMAALAGHALAACTPAAASVAPSASASDHVSISMSWGSVQGPPAYGTVSVGDGTWMVGAEIPPGMYRAHAPRSCHFARLRLADGTTTGAMTPIQAFDSPPGASLLIAIEYGDRAFQTSGCGQWRAI